LQRSWSISPPSSDRSVAKTPAPFRQSR